jgi:8-oxo-dGTP pyrophosphatase MutT (NUDIX family)
MFMKPHNYVSMLMFSADGTKVILLTKDKPAFLAGKLCPVGGKLEHGEDPILAAIREFSEEAGVTTVEAEWMQYALCTGPDWQMHCYVAFSDLVFDCRTMESEPISLHDVSTLLATIANNPDLGSPDLISLVGLAGQQRRRRVIGHLSYV